VKLDNIKHLKYIIVRSKTNTRNEGRIYMHVDYGAKNGGELRAKGRRYRYARGVCGLL
jgi:hypothetical protein